MVFLNQEEQKKPEEQPPIVDVPQLKGFQTVVGRRTSHEHSRRSICKNTSIQGLHGHGRRGGIGTGIVPDAGQVFMESVVEERPEVLSGPALNYPDLLRQAGVQGRVLVQAIIDTSGRAEPPSVKVIQVPIQASTNRPRTTCCGRCSARARARTGGSCVGELADRLQDQEIGDTMSYAELWASMGPFAQGIVVVMFIMSACRGRASISKQIYLRKSQKETRKFAPEFSRYLQEEQLDGAIALAEEKQEESRRARAG